MKKLIGWCVFENREQIDWYISEKERLYKIIKKVNNILIIFFPYLYSTFYYSINKNEHIFFLNLNKKYI